MNVVVVVCGGLTEILQAAPLMAAASAAVDDPVLVVGPSDAADLAQGLKGADRYVGVRGLGPRPTAAGLARLWRELRTRRLDVALVCSELVSVRAAVHLSGIPRRVGCAGRRELRSSQRHGALPAIGQPRPGMARPGRRARGRSRA